MDTALFNGKEYYWDGRYYARHKGLPVPIRAHFEVWTDLFGPVPAGYVIHHWDHDRRNNRFENLIVLTARAHQELHARTDNRAERMRGVQLLGLEEAKKWHKSSAGRAQHKEQFKQLMEKIGDLDCKECGKTFTPTNFRQKFCCKRCNNRVKSRTWRARQKEITKLDIE